MTCVHYLVVISVGLVRDPVRVHHPGTLCIKWYETPNLDHL